jgi:nitroreductase
MTKEQEALKLALEALEKIALAGMSPSPEMCDNGRDAWHARQAWSFIGIAARALDPIKEALAQPEQEPVGRLLIKDGYISVAAMIQKDGEYLLYVAPPKRQPLTEAAVNDLFLPLVADGRTKIFTAKNWFQAGLVTGEVEHGIGDKT